MQAAGFLHYATFKGSKLASPIERGNKNVLKHFVLLIKCDQAGGFPYRREISNQVDYRLKNMVVDSHIHLFSPLVCADRNPYLNDGQFKCLYGNRKAVTIDHIQAIAAMDDAGVDYAVAMGFPWEGEEFCQEQNEYLRSVTESTGGKILSFGTVPLRSGRGIETWVRDIKRQGFSGIGEVAFYRDGVTSGALEFLINLLGAAREHSMPVCLHVNEPVGRQYTGKYLPEFHLLYSALEGFQDVSIILSHWGGGLLFYELMRDVSSAFRNCYYDTAATPFLYSDTIYDVSLRIVGSKKILFGSDYPLTDYRRYLDPIRGSVSNEESLKDILGRNAADLLNIRP
jgi:uncharacterized protein